MSRKHLVKTYISKNILDTFINFWVILPLWDTLLESLTLTWFQLTLLNFWLFYFTLEAYFLYTLKQNMKVGNPIRNPIRNGRVRDRVRVRESPKGLRLLLSEVLLNIGPFRIPNHCFMEKNPIMFCYFFPSDDIYL